jgi:rsbT antagonist protein RsbS
MEIPIFKQGEYLIVSIQSVLADVDLMKLQDNLVTQVGIYHTRGVIMDIGYLDVIDSFAARTLRNIAYMVKLRGAEVVIVGIQPDVAYAMVQLGLSLKEVETALDLEEGLVLLKQRIKAGRDND